MKENSFGVAFLFLLQIIIYYDHVTRPNSGQRLDPHSKPKFSGSDKNVLCW
jgi:hypothetical protein